MQKQILSLMLVVSCALSSVCVAQETKRPEADPALRVMGGIRTADKTDALMLQTLVADIEVLEADAGFSQNRSEALKTIKAKFQEKFGQFPTDVTLNMPRLNKCIEDRESFKTQRDSCRTDLGACNSNLDKCMTDRDLFKTQRDTCNSDLGQCNKDLKACGSDLNKCAKNLGECEVSLEACANAEAALQNKYDALLKASNEFKDLYGRFSMTTSVLRNSLLTTTAEELKANYKQYADLKDQFVVLLKKEHVTAAINPADPELEGHVEDQIALLS